MPLTNGGVHVTNGGVAVSVAAGDPSTTTLGGNTTLSVEVLLATAEALDFNPTPEDVNVPRTLWVVPEGKRAIVTDIRLRDWAFGAGPPWPVGDSIRIVFGWNGDGDVAGWDTEEAGQFPGTVVSIAHDNVDLENVPPRGIFVPAVLGEGGDTLDLIFTRETGGDPLFLTVDVFGRVEDMLLGLLPRTPR